MIKRSVMYGLALAFTCITLLTACSLIEKPSNKQEHLVGTETWETTASTDTLPHFLTEHTDLTNNLYSEVPQHAHIMGELNCYCGCMLGTEFDKPHDSLLRCYWAEKPNGDGEVVWTDHSTTCGVCKKEMEMVIAMQKDGKTTDEIRQAIDTAYKGN